MRLDLKLQISRQDLWHKFDYYVQEWGMHSLQIEKKNMTDVTTRGITSITNEENCVMYLYFQNALLQSRKISILIWFQVTYALFSYGRKQRKRKILLVFLESFFSSTADGVLFITLNGSRCKERNIKTVFLQFYSNWQIMI